MNKNTIIILVLAAIFGGFIGGLVGGNQSARLGGDTNYDSVDVTDGYKVDGTTVIDGSGNVDAPITTSALTVGTSGDVADRINHGFCNIQATATTITASSSVTSTCGGGTNGGTALTGITAGDVCFLSTATTTPVTNEGLRIVGASASTTSGFITVVINNQTGTTFTWTAAASTSLPYLCIDS